ncbi:MAG: hypothetical protein QXK18_04545 [Candidatus Bathyarchaeia archaeon]
MSDFRQAMYYSNLSKAYESYLSYTGVISKEVKEIIKAVDTSTRASISGGEL